MTKYNPINRNEKGFYMLDEWISIDDIGRSYNDKIFTFETYIQYENSYIEEILNFMQLNTINYMKILEIEKISKNNMIGDKYEIYMYNMWI